MKHATILLALAMLVITAITVAQQRGASVGSRQYPQWEVKVLHPQEIAAGRYVQVRPYELDNMAAEGWELVGVSTFVLRNEEREGPNHERPMVTQAYVSYAFKRLKRDQ